VHHNRFPQVTNHELSRRKAVLYCDDSTCMHCRVRCVTEKGINRGLESDAVSRIKCVDLGWCKSWMELGAKQQANKEELHASPYLELCIVEIYPSIEQLLHQFTDVSLVCTMFIHNVGEVNQFWRWGKGCCGCGVCLSSYSSRGSPDLRDQWKPRWVFTPEGGVLSDRTFWKNGVNV